MLGWCSFFSRRWSTATLIYFLHLFRAAVVITYNVIFFGLLHVCPIKRVHSKSDHLPRVPLPLTWQSRNVCDEPARYICGGDLRIVDQGRVQVLLGL